MKDFFPDANFVLSMNALSENEAENLTPLDLNYKQLERFYSILRSHCAFAPTTLGMLMNRWGVIRPPNFEVMPEVFFANLIPHILSGEAELNRGKFFGGLEVYLKTILTEIDFSLTELIFREFPRKIVLWVTRGKNVHTISSQYLWKDYIFQIVLPEEKTIDLKNVTHNNYDHNDNNKVLTRLKFEDLLKQNGVDKKVKQQIDHFLEQQQNSSGSIEGTLENLIKNFHFYGLNDKNNHRSLNKSVKEQFEKVLQAKKDQIFKTLRLHNLIPYWTDIIYIPSAGNIDKRGIQEGAGGIILFEYLPREQVDREGQLRDTRFIQLLNRVKYFYGLVQQNYSYLIFQDRKRIQQHYAVQSAASAIMARNMSHHIGSHVIPRTTLEALKKRLVEFFFNEQGPDTLKECLMLYDMTRDLKDPLDDYMRRKAEFIAEATTEPVLSTRSAHFFQEIVFPFIRNTALMDTLAANEGFGYSSFDSSSLVIRCFKKEGGNIREFIPRFRHPVYDDEMKIGSETLPCIPYAGRSAKDRGTALVSYVREEDQDVRVALPGSVGEMAFYGILENIIRNTAKHSGAQKDRDDTKNLEINIIIYDQEEDQDYYPVEIYENLTGPNQKLDWKQDGQNKTGTLKEMVRHYIEASIIDDQGKLREKAWGIAEMAISASLLKGCLDLKSTSLQVEAHPPIRKFSQTATGLSECLIYTIRMMKARTALLIGFEDPPNKREWERKGFSFVKNLDEFLESKDSAEKTPVSFQFTVILANTLQQEGGDQYPLDKIRHRLPFRIIIAVTHDDTYKRFSKYPCDALTFESPPMDDGADALSKWLWEIWLRRWRIENNNDPYCYGIDLYLGQKNDKIEQPTKSWIENADKFNKECNETDRPYCMRIWGREASSDVKRFTDWEKPPLNRRLILDRHGLLAQYSNEPLRDNDCYAVIDKSNADFDAVFNPSFSDPFVLPYELLEAGLLRILVLDERIAQKAMDSLGGTEGTRDAVVQTLLGRDDFSPTLWHLAARANVFVVTHLDIFGASTKKGDTPLKLELAKKEYGKRRDAFLKQTEDKRRSSARVSCPSLKLRVDIAKDEDNVNIAIERVGPGFSDSKSSHIITDMDAVIVHQGILDSIKQQGKCEKNFLEYLQKKIPWLIIESGRGIPSEVKESLYKFLPFSIVERTFHRQRIAKLGLTRALMELTRSR